MAALAPDVIVLEYAGVYEETVDEVRDLLRRSGTRRAVLVCGFGRREVFDALAELGATILRAPVSLDELAVACRTRPVEVPSDDANPRSLLRSELGESIPPRRFDDDDLVRLASRSRSVECECPEHLVTLVGSLSAFEAYSANCRNRSPEDAELHAYLHRVSAHARAIIEEALENVAEVEGLLR